MMNLKEYLKNKSKIKIALHVLLGIGASLMFLGYAERHTFIQLALSTFLVFALEFVIVEYVLQNIVFKSKAKMEDAVLTGVSGFIPFVYYVLAYGVIFNGQETAEGMRHAEFFTGVVFVLLSVIGWAYIEILKKKK